MQGILSKLWGDGFATDAYSSSNISFPLYISACIWGAVSRKRVQLLHLSCSLNRYISEVVLKASQHVSDEPQVAVVRSRNKPTLKPHIVSSVA